MLERTLGFTVVVEAEFVHRTVVNRPSMADIPLLEALFSSRGKARNVCACGLKLGKRRDQTMVVKIVIDAKVLTVTDSLIEL